MNNISNIHDCYGCGVCSIVCGKKIINIKLNIDGFYEPTLTGISACTNCGLCTEVCAFTHRELAIPNCKPIKSYAAWSKEYAVQHKCSSGGVGYELGCTLMKQGYEVCGVRYNPETERAEHYIASTPEELIPTIGSKYIQSYTLDGFHAIDRKRKYLVTGTPCQIDSFRRYIQKFRIENNFVLMDFFCHSVPSLWAWKKYLHIVKRTTGNIDYVSWRNKQTGWHDSWAMKIEGKKATVYSRLSKGDIFYNLFLGDFCCNRACQKDCKYKYDQSSADIRIGDLWGKTYQHNEDGVSAAIAFTPKGNKIIRSLNCTLIEHPFDIVAEGQMKRNCRKAKLSYIVKQWIKDPQFISETYWQLLFRCENLIKTPQRVTNKIIRIIKAIK